MGVKRHQRVVRHKAHQLDTSDFLQPAVSAGEAQNETKSKTSKQQLVELTRRSRLLGLHTRLLCKTCGTVQDVTDVFPNRTVKLSCGHRRSPLTLPSSMTSQGLTPEELQAAERCMDAGCTSDATAVLECELTENLVRQMEAASLMGAVNG